jgi:cytochrome oxidase Cu insertion factor (SCO1/SenC/PrrC family)
MSNPSPIDLTNPLVVALFRHSIYVTGVLWIIAIALVLLLGAVLLGRVGTFNLSLAGLNEARNRSYLRMAFGAIWLIDGILQFQVSMPLGLANNVVAPMTSGTPHWLHLLMNDGIGVWNNHPITLAVGTAWIQVGLGILLLVSNSTVGRFAGAASAGWAAMIWLIGNGAGGIFQSSSSILFGWPGATLFYVVAGVWLAMSPTSFPEKFSRYTLRGLSVIVGIAAVLQVLPSRGFWHGGNSNALTAMTRSMTQTPQPQLLAEIVRRGGDIAGSMGGGFNIVIILWLLVCAVGLWMASQRGWRWPVWAFVVGCVIFWLVSEDGAVYGGLATDLNSLIPMAALAWAAAPQHVRREPLPRRLPREMRSSSGSVLASFAGAMVIFSIASMGLATLSSSESTFFVAQNGSAVEANTVAPKFTLTDQFDKSYTLGEHANRYTLLTFLDPTCWTDCPLLAQQLGRVREELGPSAKVDIVAVAADPYHETLAYVNHFIATHHMKSVQNFYFVTGKLAVTRPVWNSYGITVEMKPTDKMSIHSDYMFIINPKGRLKWIIPDDPAHSWAIENSSESELLNLLHQSGLASS